MLSSKNQHEHGINDLGPLKNEKRQNLPEKLFCPGWFTHELFKGQATVLLISFNICTFCICEKVTSDQIYCTQIVNSINYLAASTAQVVLLYSGAGRLVPFVLSSPLHHSGEEIHQLVLHIEVCITSQVFVSSAPGQVLLVLFNFQVTGLAHQPGGLVLVIMMPLVDHSNGNKCLPCCLQR